MRPKVAPFRWDKRRLRVPELKRLFGDPEEFPFVGNRASIQSPLGNNVHLPVAHALASIIRAWFKGAPDTACVDGQGSALGANESARTGPTRVFSELGIALLPWAVLKALGRPKLAGALSAREADVGLRHLVA